MKFLVPFLYSFLASAAAIWILLLMKAQPSSGRRLSLQRLGGVVVILVFILAVLLNKDLVITKPIAGILIGGLLILFFGLWDDLKNLSWQRQLLFQIIIAVIAISLGVRSEHLTNPFGGVINLDNPAIYSILYTLYIILFTNSLNWLDGIDGLAGSVTLVALAVVFFLSLLPHVNQPAVAILCSIASGAVLGFLVFNRHPAKILAGTSGAWFFGFLLASLSIFAGAKIATVLMVALIPILDLVCVVLERWRAGQSVFSRDNRHLHYKLLELGLREKQIVIGVSLVSAGIGVAALNLKAAGKLLFIVMFSFLYFMAMQTLNAKCKYQKSK